MHLINKRTLTICKIFSLSAALSGCGGGSGGEATTATPVNFTVASVVNSGSGAIFPETSTLKAGTNAEFTIKAADGFKILSVTGCNGTLVDNIYRISNITANCTIFVAFSPTSVNFKITTSASEGGSITPAQQIINEGGTANFIVSANPGFNIAEVKGCQGTLTGNEYRITNVKSDCVLSAIFADNRQRPSGIKFLLNESNARLSWVGTPNSTYKIYVAEEKFEDAKNPAIEFSTILTNEPLAVVPLPKSYNHVFVRVAAVYESIELLSTEMLEIENNYQPIGKLNDTGITICLNDSLQISNCDSSSSTRQDGKIGRDAEAIAKLIGKKGNGTAGFDFTKIDVLGRSLNNQTAQWNNNGSETDGTKWSCARDNVTGLIWEIKASEGIRDKSQIFTWYSDKNSENGGMPGSKTFGSCTHDLCDTSAYIKYLNKIKLCGSSNWRLPSRTEVLGLIINQGTSPRLDPLIFPDSLSDTTYWSSNSYAPDVNNAWAITTNTGIAIWYPKVKPLNVRLVHSK